MEVATRPACEADYQWLFGLKVASMRSYVEAVYGWDEDLQRTIFDKDFRPHDIQIITVGGADAGMFELSRESDGFFLKRIEIHPEYQRRGVGSRIIREIIRRASEVDEPVRLHVFKVNPARNLYERLGFEVIKETATHYQMLLDAASIQTAEQDSDGKTDSVSS